MIFREKKEFKLTIAKNHWHFRHRILSSLCFNWNLGHKYVFKQLILSPYLWNISVSSIIHFSVFLVPRGIHPSLRQWYTPPVSDFPLFPKEFSDSVENFPNFTFSQKCFSISSAKISDELFLIIDYKFWISPSIFAFSLHFPSISGKLLFPPTFANSPWFRKIYVFLTYFMCFFWAVWVTALSISCKEWLFSISNMVTVPVREDLARASTLWKVALYSSISDPTLPLLRSLDGQRPERMAFLSKQGSFLTRQESSSSVHLLSSRLHLILHLNWKSTSILYLVTHNCRQ